MRSPSGRRIVLAGCAGVLAVCAVGWLFARSQGYHITLLKPSEWGFGVEQAWTLYTPYSSLWEAKRKYGFFAITR